MLARNKLECWLEENRGREWCYSMHNNGLYLFFCLNFSSLVERFVQSVLQYEIRMTNEEVWIKKLVEEISEMANDVMRLESKEQLEKKKDMVKKKLARLLNALPEENDQVDILLEKADVEIDEYLEFLFEIMIFTIDITKKGRLYNDEIFLMSTKMKLMSEKENIIQLFREANVGCQVVNS